jgi:lactose/L-arabinose transport system permease protein
MKAVTMAHSAAHATSPAEMATVLTPKGLSVRHPQDLLRRIIQARWAYLFIAPFYVLFAIFGLYPLLFSVYLSFTKWNGRGPQVMIGLDNYQLLLHDDVFWRSMMNGVILFFLYVPLMTLLALALAVILNSQRVRGFQLFRTLIFMPFVTNMVAAGFTFQILLNQNYGLFNLMLGWLGIQPVPWLNSEWGARVSLSLLIIWAWLGYNMVIMLAGLQTIPKELTEAALIDGANPLQAFFLVTIPLMKPVILFSVVLSTMGSFGLFTEDMSLFSQSQGFGPINATVTPIVDIFTEAFRNFRLGYASAQGYVYFALIFVLTLLQVRYFGQHE